MNNSFNSFGVWLGTLLACAMPILTLAQSNSVVTIDADKVMSINGRKVFGLMISAGPPTFAKTPDGRDGLDELRSGGILFERVPNTTIWKLSNSLNPEVVATNQATLDWCAAHGMFCHLNLKDLSYFPTNDTNTPALLQTVVNMFKNHPGLGMWKNKDEAWWGGISAPDLQRGYDIIHQLDTNHPVEQTHAPRGTVSDLRPYNSTADILMLDDYPVVASGSASNPPITNTAVSQFGDWTKQLSQVANGQKEFFMIEQIAFSGVVPPAHTLIFPTFKQERFMAYQAIVNGARGLMFFGGDYQNTWTNAADIAVGWNWSFWTNTLKPLTLQLAEGSPLLDGLVAPESLLPISMSGTAYPDIEFCVRESGTNLYLLATKREGATVNGTFSGLPVWATNATVLFETNAGVARTISATGGAFNDSFSQWDVHVYRFSYRGTTPTFTYQPPSRTNVIGATSVFVATAMGPGPLTYQWRKNGINLGNTATTSGATTTKLTLSNLALSDAGSFDLVVSGSGSVTSAAATLTVSTNTPPVILVQPTSQSNFIGTQVSFTVVATNAAGGSALSFQWQQNGADLFDDTNFSGTTTSSLTLSSIGIADAGSYSVVIANNLGSIISSNAVLNVVVPPSTPYWTTMWRATPGVDPWVTSTGGQNMPNERTIAYNALSNQLYVVQRGGGTSALVTIYVLNAVTGGFQYKLNTNGYNYTGNIPLCGIAVADDGAIYACNNDTVGTGFPAFKIYRWANSDPNTPPQLIYSGDPLGGVNARWGDALDARGSGLNTVLIADNRQPAAANPLLIPAVFVLQPGDAFFTNFTGKYYALDTNNNPALTGSSIGHSLRFDAVGTNFWQKHYGQALAKNAYNPTGTNGSAAKFLNTYSNFSSMIGPVDLLVQSNLLAAINFSGVGSFTPDVLELYDISDLKSPVLVSAAGFPVNKLSNANRIGQVIMTSNYVFALDGNNGMLAFRLSGPTPPIIDSISLQAQNTLLMNFSGEPWFGYDLLGSTNLADWFVVTNLTAAGNGQFQFSTTIPTNSPTQFFRLR